MHFHRSAFKLQFEVGMTLTLDKSPLPPKAPFLDCSVSMLKDPYRLISKLCVQLNSNCFRTRLFGKPVICFQGEAAARHFYDPQLTIRKGSAPEPLKATLFGKGAIQGKDQKEHQSLKSLFLSLLTADSIQELNRFFLRELTLSCKRWTSCRNISLYEELRPALTRSVCLWTGVPLPKDEIPMRTADLTAMFDSAVAPGLGHLRARWGRYHSETWIRKMVHQHRIGASPFPSNSPAHKISCFVDANGKALSDRVAAVEILNLLRPTVAISVYLTFLMHALIQYPENRGNVLSDPRFCLAFVQEVRRFYPFFPSVMAKSRREFQFGEFRIPAGTRLILDLYGTNHDPHFWADPMSFRPDRFLDLKPSAFSFIPQGGGEPSITHRCPGEDPTIALMCTAAAFFSKQMRFQVPSQNLEIDFARLPALPKSHLILSEVEWIPDRTQTLSKCPPAQARPADRNMADLRGEPRQ
jgi:fatty-acid peroxygenase